MEAPEGTEASTSTNFALIGEDDDLILDDDEKVAALNRFFSRVGTTFDSSEFRQDHLEEVLGQLRDRADAFLPHTATEREENAPISVAEVQKGVKSLKLSKACAPDGIPAELLRHGGSGVCESLTWLFNLSWNRGYLPLDWRTAHITPVPKEPQARTFDRFRPMSLVCRQ